MDGHRRTAPADREAMGGVIGVGFPRRLSTIWKGLSRALPLPAPGLKSRDGTEQPKRPGVSSEVALRNDCPLSIRYAYDFEAFLPEMFQRCQGLSAGGTDDQNGGTVFGVSRFNNKIHDCTRHRARM